MASSFATGPSFKMRAATTAIIIAYSHMSLQNSNNSSRVAGEFPNTLFWHTREPTNFFGCLNVLVYSGTLQHVSRGGS